MTFPSLAPWLTGTISQKLLRMAQGAALGRPTATFAGGVNPTTQGGSHGVVGGDDLKVTISSGLTMSVAVGQAYINGTSSLTQGTYYTYNDAAATIALVAHNSQPRIDLVYVRARDNAEDSGGATAIAFDKVTGTPAGSPSAPAPLSGSIVLAQILVPATSGAVTITDTRPYAAGLGGLIRCRSTLRPSGVAAWQGQTIYETDTNRTWKNTSATVGTPTWVPMSGRYGASVSIASYSLATLASATIGFDTEGYDTDAFHAGSSTQLIVPAGLGGGYSLAAYAATPGGGTTPVSGATAVTLLVNGTIVSQGWMPVGAGAAGAASIEALAAGDIVTVQLYNGHSATLGFFVSAKMLRVSD